MKTTKEDLFTVWAFSEKCSHYIEITSPCTHNEATIIKKCLNKINSEEFISMFSDFKIKIISCNRCVYHSGHNTCWSIKGNCNISHLKCDYRLDTLHKEYNGKHENQ